ncbi:hypothetical protein [Ferruginivarius sediminum]|uniref:Uncharacterized protein n=1 Tax=Ferruginivarius sediminum TaxID=2661937 RepID=A0A369TB76_9PROT|nr:hypothetical protein [Ferruginivarius sediminum]RDD60186.1 hypothetical protein DRB17_19380 [Ferruginivarius sediminum]
MPVFHLRPGRRHSARPGFKLANAFKTPDCACRQFSPAALEQWESISHRLAGEVVEIFPVTAAIGGGQVREPLAVWVHTHVVRKLACLDPDHQPPGLAEALAADTITQFNLPSIDHWAA